MRSLSSSTKTSDSASAPPSAEQPDELSLFLRQILLRSSSSASSSSSSSFASASFMSSAQIRPENSDFQSRSVLVSSSDRFLLGGDGVEPSSSSSGLMFSDSGDYFPMNVPSSFVGAVESNDLDEYDCESEEGLEALVGEMTVKPLHGRSSSKRSRAAEVHNLSEKRRRSRINEKMKALQNLIPNSNKTDKASMLDEAIEYLKQLQLQVQMLSMRNGLSLHPMCLPGVLQPLQLSQMRSTFREGNESFHLNTTGRLSTNQETARQNICNLPNQCTPSNLPSISNPTQIINLETSFGLESSIRAHLESFQLHTSSEKICGEDMLPHHQQLDVHHSDTNPLGSLPFGTQASKPNHHASLEPCVLRELSKGVLPKNIEQNQICFSNLNRMNGRRTAIRDDLKIGRP